MTVYLGLVLVNNQLDTQCFFRIYEKKNIWYMSLYVGDRLVCRCTLDGHLHISDVVLIQLILLMMNTRLLETCRELE